MLAGKAEGRSLLIGEDQEPERRQEVGLSYKLHLHSHTRQSLTFSS